MGYALKLEFSGNVPEYLLFPCTLSAATDSGTSPPLVRHLGTSEFGVRIMDVSSIATSYAAFGGVLVGFAFAGLSIYVNRSPGSGPDGGAVDVLITRQGDPMHIGLIKVSAVTATGFYAMASLGISTFLYANLSGTGSDEPTGPAGNALLVYGVAFALSVLTLFYFMTLMLFESSLTRPAAKPAFWVGTIAGSIVVLRFLAGSAQDARLALCPSKHPLCYPGAPYTTLGITITLLAAGVIFVGITRTGVLEFRPFSWLLALLVHRPSLPSTGVFLTSVAVATLASLYLNALTGPPPGWFISGSYAIGIILIVLFALATGSVIYPRLHGTRLTGSADIQETPAQVAWWRRIRARQAELNNTAYLEYSCGSRPIAQNGNLIWKVPSMGGELDTRFNIWHDKSPWHLGGRMFLVDSGKHAAPGHGHGVRVTLKTGSGAELREIEHDLIGPGQIRLSDDRKPSISDDLQVAIRRLDSSAGFERERLTADEREHAG
jgi:hypothetical protein